MEETLKRHLKTQLVDTATAGVYQHGVKKLDKNHLIDNVAHDDLIKIENGIIK